MCRSVAHLGLLGAHCVGEQVNNPPRFGGAQQRRRTMTNAKERIDHVQRELQLNALTCRCILKQLMQDLEEGDAGQDTLHEAAAALKQWSALSSAAVGAWDAFATDGLGQRSDGGAS